jgi:hypothetical protein
MHDGCMIAGIWRGVIRAVDAQEYEVADGGLPAQANLLCSAGCGTAAG